MKPFILGAIFARGGSKGVPQKNIRPLRGKPLIAYAIKIAKSVSLIDRLIVSTDDKKIAKIAREHGAEVPFMRPAHLAGDHSAELLSWRHAIEIFEKQNNQKVDVLVSMPTTSPLRNKNDIRRCIQKLLTTDADIVITVKEAERSPYFNMVKIDPQGNAHLVMNSRKKISQRQESPKVYDLTTVAYAARRAFVKKADSILKGKVKAVVIPKERALDIDTLFDFEVAEYLMTKRKRKE